ncbi:hypothetical protein B1759_02350 [Rubrivirga sp. SAORIC476]|uniref:hypothetical protein n=1 Tax=Rubrivirga sp. SAORIC476 TaxID=1961794 RepID=UPI000BA97166|nr:hypothetical protein [Rubrivirga sp. SAORIC476]MAQ92163.1 hypothetical protein [Rhodothermaceae bacterium]MBC13558.1 hypothetical protein [Rhodothermaceae bacterium]PAP80261.1 hypothetical protein B1759_02350 [Rubrivirga sp. SAORIC476]
MLTPYSVKDALTAAALEEGWAQTLAEWHDAAHSQILATLAYTRGLRNQILNVTAEMDSMEELERILALCYIDLKCQWSILNVQIQYAAAHRGEIREDLMYRATCVTQLLDRVEGLLSQSDVDAMTEMISEPIGSAGYGAAASAPAPPPAPVPPPVAPVRMAPAQDRPIPVAPAPFAPLSPAYVARPQPGPSRPVHPTPEEIGTPELPV